MKVDYVSKQVTVSKRHGKKNLSDKITMRIHSFFTKLDIYIITQISRAKNHNFVEFSVSQIQFLKCEYYPILDTLFSQFLNLLGSQVVNYVSQ